MTPGSLSIKREAAPWSKAQTEGYLAVAAVGVLAGVAVTFARTPIHLPGHKAVWWITPVLVARLLTGRRAGATVGAVATVVTTLILGGRLAGGALAAPLVLLAGGLLDVTAERRPATGWSTIAWLGAGAAGANLICFIKRVFEPTGGFWSIGNLDELVRAAASYAFFGFLAGAIAALIAHAITRTRRPISS